MNIVTHYGIIDKKNILNEMIKRLIGIKGVVARENDEVNVF